MFPAPWGGGALPVIPGEINTASNVGASGVGVVDSKTGVDIAFRKIAAASAKVTVVLNGQEIDIDLGPLRAFAVANKTADWNILDADSFSLFTNLGSTGVVLGQLPAAPTNGTMYFFFVATAQTLRILVNASQSIKIGLSVATVRITSANPGDFAFLIYTGNNTWAGIISGAWVFL